MHRLTNVLMYAITDITTWGADLPLMVGHVRTRAYPYIFKLICFFMVGTVVSLLAL